MSTSRKIPPGFRKAGYTEEAYRWLCEVERPRDWAYWCTPQKAEYCQRKAEGRRRDDLPDIEEAF